MNMQLRFVLREELIPVPNSNFVRMDKRYVLQQIVNHDERGQPIWQDVPLVNESDEQNKGFE